MMLEKIQQSMQSPIMKLLMFVIIVFFIGAGYFGPSMLGGDSQQVAEIDGISISSERVQTQFDSIRQREGQNFENKYPTEASREQLKKNIAQQLIDQEIISAGITRAGFSASEEQVKEWIRTNEMFQIAGEYSPMRAREILRQNGLSESRLSGIAKDEITQQQLQTGISSSAFALSNEIETLYQLQQQSRNVRVLRVPLKTFLDDVSVDEKAIKDYYQKNQDRFMQPEQINLRYVRLSVANLVDAQKDAVTEDEIKQYYEQQKSSYGEPAEIQVAHILIDNSVDDAEQKAQDLLKQIQQGADFATVAKENSSDTFSAEKGGKLDWVDAVEQSESSSGTGWAPEFEKAALSLESKGDITDVIESQYGYHIIKLVDRHEGTFKSIDEVREQIVTALATEAADKEFYSKESKLDDALFQYGDDIETFAEQVGLEVNETGMFSQQNGSGIASNPALLEKAFTAQIIDSKEVSDKILLSSNDVVYVTAKAYQAEAVKPLDEVEEQIVTALTQEKAQQKTEDFANEVLATVKEGQSAESLVSDKGLEWQENTDLNRRDSGMRFDLVSAAYQVPAPTGDKSSYSVKPLLNGDYAVIELKGVSYPDAADMDKATQTQLNQMAQRLSNQAEITNLFEYFRNTVEIKR